MFELSGTVKEIFKEQSFDSGFNKREFVVTTEAERYPQDIKFECVKEKVELISQLHKGNKVKVFFDLRGREWKGNYYVNLNAWKVEIANDRRLEEATLEVDPSDEILDEEMPEQCF